MKTVKQTLLARPWMVPKKALGAMWPTGLCGSGSQPVLLATQFASKVFLVACLTASQKDRVQFSVDAQMKQNIPHSYAMRPIVCNCRQCRPDILEMEKETIKYLRELEERLARENAPVAHLDRAGLS